MKSDYNNCMGDITQNYSFFNTIIMHRYNTQIHTQMKNPNVFCWKCMDAKNCTLDCITIKNYNYFVIIRSLKSVVFVIQINIICGIFFCVYWFKFCELKIILFLLWHLSDTCSFVYLNNFNYNNILPRSS